MHIPRIEVRSLDETVEAVDLGQTPADVVFLSFSDSDLNALARAYGAVREPKPTLRIASLAALRHPFSIDLYLETVCARAKLVVARVLGGADYWRYGVDELAALARRRDVKLALLPGDRRWDKRLEEASTLGGEAVKRIWRYFDEGGPHNMAACLSFSLPSLAARRTPRRPRRSAPSVALRAPVLRPHRPRRTPSLSSIARFISRAISRRSRRWPWRSATRVLRRRASS